MNLKNTSEYIVTKRWDIKKTQKFSLAIHSFRLSEKVVFYLFFGIFTLCALVLLSRVNQAYLVEQPARGGTLEEGVIGYPRYINPVLAISDAGRDLASLVYSGLMKTDEFGTLVPDLAKSYSISEDGLTYDFIIKDNATFSDGHPVTADDIEFTIQKIQDPSLKSPKASNWEGITVEKVNAKEIQFILKKPYGPFLQNTTLGILPKHLWINATDPDSFTLSDLNRQPLGSGPYVIKNIKTDSSGLPVYYQLVPFKNYIGGEAYIQNIIVRYYPDQESLLNAYNRNEIQDVNSVGADEIDYLKTRNNIIATSTLPRVFGVFFNQSADPVLVHKEVREALNASVDRNEIIKEVLNGYGEPTIEPIPASLLDLSASSTIAKDSATSSDKIAVAQKILTDAGWHLNAESLMEKTDSKSKSSETIKLTISTVNLPDLVKTADILKETWQKLGAIVDVKVFEATDLNQNVIRPRKYDALLFGEVIPPGMDIYGFWHSSERNDPGLNIALYTNGKADKLLETARATSDQNVARDNYRQFEELVNEDVPAVFLYSPNFIYTVPSNLGGFKLENLTVSSDRFAGISNWYLDTEKVWRIFAK